MCPVFANPEPPKNGGCLPYITIVIIVIVTVFFL